MDQGLKELLRAHTSQELKRLMRQSLDIQVRMMAYGILINRNAFKRGKR